MSTGGTNEIKPEIKGTKMPEFTEEQKKLLEQQEADFKAKVIKQDRAQRGAAHFRRLISSRKVIHGRKTGRKKRF